MSVGAYRAAELICRNILMAVAVEKGAKPGGTFAGYIEHLEGAGYVTPPMTPWVKQIKDHGNRAGHDIDPVTKERAEGTVWFTSTLLTLTYETEHRRKTFAEAPEPNAGPEK